MAIDKKKSLFFAGGKKISLETNDEQKGLRIKKVADGWTITLSLFISDEESKDVIRAFKDFPPLTEEQDFDDAYPNQVFMQAFKDEAATDPIDINLGDVFFNITHHKDEDGEITLVIRPLAIGKTQNSKTQNIVVD